MPALCYTIWRDSGLAAHLSVCKEFCAVWFAEYCHNVLFMLEDVQVQQLLCRFVAGVAAAGGDGGQAAAWRQQRSRHG
jgi:hypothetical protein